MAIEVFNRYEHKYLLDKETFKNVIKVMDLHMELDKHNPDYKPYTISNLYYDTPDYYLIRHSLEKPSYKEKLRLRAYGIPCKDTKVFLEIKKKFNGIVNKRRSTLKLSEAYDFATTGEVPDFKNYMNAQVLKEIEYFLRMYNIVPRLYLAYDRIAYFDNGNPDLRISFDTNIRFRRNDLLLENGDYGEKLLPDDIVLMEIKTSMAKPLWLAEMLTSSKIRRESFSKYGTAYKQSILNKTEKISA